MKERLIKFLKERGIYTQYLVNIRTTTKRNSSLNSIIKLSGDMYEDYLDLCFSWWKTPEGSDYWGVIYEDWRDIVKGERKTKKYI